MSFKLTQAEKDRFGQRLVAHFFTISNWLDTGEPMEALNCAWCGQLVATYNRTGLCFDCVDIKDRPSCPR